MSAMNTVPAQPSTSILSGHKLPKHYRNGSRIKKYYTYHNKIDFSL